MSSYRPTLNYVPVGDVPKFTKLVDVVTARVGSLDKACKVLGVSEVTVRAMREIGRLTDKQARRILDGYKRWKAAQ